MLLAINCSKTHVQRAAKDYKEFLGGLGYVEFFLECAKTIPTQDLMRCSPMGNLFTGTITFREGGELGENKRCCSLDSIKSMCICCSWRHSQIAICQTGPHLVLIPESIQIVAGWKLHKTKRTESTQTAAVRWLCQSTGRR